MPSPSYVRTAVSPSLIFVLLIGCALAAVVLLPSKRALLERQLHDGANERALATLHSLTPSERAKDPAFYALVEMRLQRQQSGAQSPEQIRAQLSAACRSYEQYGFRDDFQRELIPLLEMLPRPDKDLDLLEPSLPRMPAGVQHHLVGRLVASALAAGDPESAARVFSRYFERIAPSEVDTQEMVRLWRFAQKPAFAVAAIDHFAAKSRQKLCVAAPNLAMLRIQLLREVGHASQAFDAVRELAAANPAALDSASLFDLLVTTARESNRAVDLIPDLRERARAEPNNPKYWRLLAELAGATGQMDFALDAHQHLAVLEPDSGPHLLKAAQFYEWTGRPQMAFDYYLRALKQKEPVAVSRLLALNQGLYRDGELAAALYAAGDLLPRNEERWEAARLLARVGAFDAAAETYEKLLARDGRNVRLLQEYGRLLIDLMRYEKALAIFTRAQALEPDNRVTRQAIAELHFRLGQFEESLEDYRFLAVHVPDDDVLEDYALLAEALGRTARAAEGIQLKLQTAKKVSAADFQRLAYFDKLTGNTAEEKRVLLRGVAAFPEEPRLRVLAAYSLADDGEQGRAARVLKDHPALKNNPDLRRFYLTLLIQTKNFREAESLLSKLKPSELAQPSLMEIQAQVDEANHRLNEAAELYLKLARQQPQNPAYSIGYVRILGQQGKLSQLQSFVDAGRTNAPPELFSFAAEIFAAHNKFAQAAQCQRRFLESKPAETPEAWGFLGDILLSRGDKANARRAFQRGLDTMLERLAPIPIKHETHTNQPAAFHPGGHRARPVGAVLPGSHANHPGPTDANDRDKPGRSGT